MKKQLLDSILYVVIFNMMKLSKINKFKLCNYTFRGVVIITLKLRPKSINVLLLKTLINY